jgi:hypothetical protein
LRWTERQSIIKMDNREVKQLIVKDKPNSYEFGKVGNRFKIYYNEPVELLEHIEKLKNMGLYKNE